MCAVYLQTISNCIFILIFRYGLSRIYRLSVRIPSFWRTTIDRGIYIWYFENNEDWFGDLLRSARFYAEAIQHNSIYLSVPCRVVFVADFSINAAATVFQGRGLVVWRGGLLLKQLEILKRWEEIDAAMASSPLERILPLLDNHSSILFHQTVQHFTFYHEFGHVIQIQEREQKTTIDLAPQNGYNLKRHILEMDADEFSSLFLAAHILQYAEKQLKSINHSSLTYILAFFIVPILSDSISIYPEEIQTIDLRNEMHPHPIFRILFVTMVITEFINQNYQGEIVIDPRNVLDLAVDVVTRLTNIDLVTLWANHYEELMAYFKEIRNTDFPEGYKSAVDAWNKEIQERGA